MIVLQEFHPGKLSPLKPGKPYPKFPLYPHASGKWAVTINKKIYYFGTWARMVRGSMISVTNYLDSWREALREYEQFKRLLEDEVEE